MIEIFIIYYLMYAGSSMKIKMRKSHAFYHAQLNVLMHARRSYVLLTTFYHGSQALLWNYLCTWIHSGERIDITKLRGQN